MSLPQDNCEKPRKIPRSATLKWLACCNVSTVPRTSRGPFVSSFSIIVAGVALALVGLALLLAYWLARRLVLPLQRQIGRAHV